MSSLLLLLPACLCANLLAYLPVFLQIKGLSRQPGFWALPAVVAGHVFILHAAPASPPVSPSQQTSLWSPWSLVHCVEQIASILQSCSSLPSSSAVLSAASSALTGTRSYSSLTSTSFSTSCSNSRSLPSSACSSSRRSCNNLTGMTCSRTSELGMHHNSTPMLTKSSSNSNESAVIHRLVCSDPHRHRFDWNPQLCPWKPTRTS